MRLNKASYTIFDFETTGLYPYSGDKICEIGAVRIFPLKNAARFHSLVDPGMPVSEGAFLVNSITEEMLEGQPKISEILPSFMKFIKGSVLVAYNAGFDLGFLEAALGEKKDTLNDYKVLDALTLARRLFPGIGRYNLATAAGALGIRSDGQHRAMADALMTLGIFRKELKLLASEGIKTVEEIAGLQKTRTAAIKTVRDYKYRLIEEAIREQKRLNIVYRSVWNNRITSRTITPKQIQKGYNRLYLVAHCHLADAERNFRFDGILEAKPEGK